MCHKTNQNNTPIQQSSIGWARHCDKWTLRTTSLLTLMCRNAASCMIYDLLGARVRLAFEITDPHLPPSSAGAPYELAVAC